MKAKVRQLLVIGATSVLLAGCCTMSHTACWEYTIVRRATGPDWQTSQVSQMNELGKQGWVFVGEFGDHLYFKRAVR